MQVDTLYCDCAYTCNRKGVTETTYYEALQVLLKCHNLDHGYKILFGWCTLTERRLKTDFSHTIWASSRENLSLGFPTKRVANQSLQLQRLARKFEISLVASLDMILLDTRITKALIRLRGCAGWTAPVLFANPQRQFFSRRGPYVLCCHAPCLFNLNDKYTHWNYLHGAKDRYSNLFGEPIRMLNNVALTHLRIGLRTYGVSGIA